MEHYYFINVLLRLRCGVKLEKIYVTDLYQFGVCYDQFLGSWNNIFKGCLFFCLHHEFFSDSC